MSCKEKPPCISLYNNKDTQVLQGKTALHFPYGHCRAVKG